MKYRDCKVCGDTENRINVCGGCSNRSEDIRDERRKATKIAFVTLAVMVAISAIFLATLL